MRTIYIQLLDEGSIAYRPTLAEELGVNIFRVMPTDNYDPEDEVWEFLPGDVVKCQLEALSGSFGVQEIVLVAREKLDDNY